MEVSSGVAANDTLKIRFASAASAGIIELRAKATVVDTLGHATTVEHRVWSHGFESTGKNISDWVRLIQALSGVKDVALNANSAQLKPVDFILMPEARRTRVDITTAYLRDIVRDKRISIDELRNIVRFLKTPV